jgi:antirestriction protein ArdC
VASMAQTNRELINEYFELFAIDLGIEDFEYNGDNLLTFAQWKYKGMSVKKGSKAFIQLDLWTCKEVDAKDEDGKIIMENGKPKKEKKFYLKKASLFTIDQVEPIKKKTTSKKKKAA